MYALVAILSTALEPPKLFGWPFRVAVQLQWSGAELPCSQQLQRRMQQLQSSIPTGRWKRAFDGSASPAST